MKKIIAISAAALMGTSLIAAPAFAQVNLDVGGGAGVTVDGGSVGIDAGGNASGNAGAGVGGTGVQLGGSAGADVNVDNEATAAIGANVDGAIAAMARGSEAAATIGTMTTVSTVNVVKLDNGASAEAFVTAETENKASIDELRASLDANASVKAALEAQSVNTGDVVAADVNADGSLTVYVR